MTGQEYVSSILSRIGVKTSKSLDVYLVVYVVDDARRFKLMHCDYTLLTYRCEDYGVATLQLYPLEAIFLENEEAIRSFENVQEVLGLPVRSGITQYEDRVISVYNVINPNNTVKHSFMSRNAQVYMYKTFIPGKTPLPNNYSKTNYIKDNIPSILTRKNTIISDQSGIFSPDEELQKELLKS